MSRPCRAAPAALAVAAALTVLAGCTPPAREQASAPPVLYVANTDGGSLAAIDTGTGRIVGAPLPAGLAPWQIAPGPRGSALVLAAVPGAAHLTVVAGGTGRQEPRAVALPAGATNALIAGDGGRIAAVAYARGDGGRESAPRCVLALVDLPTAAVVSTRSTCGEGEAVVGLAITGPGSATLEAGAPGPAHLAQVTVYASVWRRPPNGARCDAGAGQRILALRFAPDRVVASAPIEGTPGPAALGAAPDGPGPRLYVSRGAPAAWRQAGECDFLSYAEQYQTAGRWDIVGLDPLTLAGESSVPVDRPPGSMALTADGRHAYFVSGLRTLVGVNLAAGRTELSAPLPDIGGAVAVAGDRLYVSQPFGHGVWVLDRRAGTLTRTIETGAHTGGVVLVDAAA